MKNKERRTTNPWRGARRAMTLIELLMVMVIMAIIMSISVPAFNSMGRGSDMRGAVSSVRATIAQSRQWAITHREPVTFCCFPRPSSTNPAYYYVTNAAGLFLQATNTLPLSIHFSDAYAVPFKTDGSLNYFGNDITIVLTNAAGIHKTITIQALTGGISVE